MIKIPTSALKKEGKSAAVWVVDKTSMTVRTQPVQMATADGNEIVIAGGLAPGMVIVTAGVHVLSEGQKVTIYQDRVAAPIAGAAQGAVVPAAAMASGAASGAVAGVSAAVSKAASPAASGK